MGGGDGTVTAALAIRVGLRAVEGAVVGVGVGCLIYKPPGISGRRGQTQVGDPTTPPTPAMRSFTQGGRIKVLTNPSDPAPYVTWPEMAVNTVLTML